MGGLTHPLIAASEPGAMSNSPVNHAYFWRGAAVESKQWAAMVAGHGD
jgi:hypothetical protein